MNSFRLLSKQQKRIRKLKARTLKEFRNEEKVFNPKRETQDYLLVTIDKVAVLIPNDMRMKFYDAKKIIQKQIKLIKSETDEYLDHYFVFNPKTRTLQKYEHDLYIDDKEIDRLARSNALQ